MVLVCSAFMALYVALTLTHFYSYDTPSWDNAIFEQAIARYAHFQAPVATIKGPGFDLLGDHFSPIIAVLAPLYRVVPRAETLLVSQCALIAWSIYPVLRVGVRYAGRAAGVAIAVSYGLAFGIQTAIYTDFHEVAFAAPLLAFAGAAYLERRWNWVVGWSLPLVLVKEDLGLTVAVVGIVLACAGAVRHGILLVVGGLTASAVSVLVLIPAMNPDGSYPYRDQLAGGTNSLASVLQTVGTGADVKVVTVLLTFGITGFAALRSPWVMVAVPNLVLRFAADNTAYWGTYFHYSLVPMTVVFVAMLDAVRRSRADRPAWWRSYASHAPAASVAAALALCMQFPLWSLTQATSYEESAKARAGAHAVAMIPRGASVLTDTGLVTHVVSGHDVYWIGDSGGVIPDYVLLDKNSGDDVDIVPWAEEEFPGSRYRQLFDRQGYILAVRVG